MTEASLPHGAADRNAQSQGEQLFVDGSLEKRAQLFREMGFPEDAIARITGLSMPEEHRPENKPKPRLNPVNLARFGIGNPTGKK